MRCCRICSRDKEEEQFVETQLICFVVQVANEVERGVSESRNEEGDVFCDN